MLLLITLIPAAYSESPVAITITPQETNPLISPDFEGLSYEISTILPDPQGNYYFSPTNFPLIQMVETLGIKSLRIGGATVDDSRLPTPSYLDLKQLFTFAKVAHLKVIYSLRLKNGDFQAGLDQVKYISQNFSESLNCFAIGNEPNEYFPNYSKYIPVWTTFFKAILAQVPNATFCGPCAWKESWSNNFAKEPVHKGKISFVSQHEYPFGPSTQVKNPEQARSRMLNKDGYDTAYQQFAPEVLKQGLAYRLEEANNYAHGGAADASDSFAAALWGLDYLHWWAAHQCQGINFHTGSHHRNAVTENFRYSVFSNAIGGYYACPLAYGILAFKIASQGRLNSVKIVEQQPKKPNIRAYSVITTDGIIYVTLINRNVTSSTPQSVTITLENPMKPYTSAEFQLLSAPQPAPAAKDRLTLGGAAINMDGAWTGSWTKLPGISTQNSFECTVPATSALILKLLPIPLSSP